MTPDCIFPATGGHFCSFFVSNINLTSLSLALLYQRLMWISIGVIQKVFSKFLLKWQKFPKMSKFLFTNIYKLCYN